jgi:hypothetical protein
MTIVAGHDPRMLTVEVTDALSSAHLADGGTMRVPLGWSWRVANATPAQRQHLESSGTGQGVHWPDIDEDMRALSMLTGPPAPPPKQRVAPEVVVECLKPSAARQGEAPVERTQQGQTKAELEAVLSAHAASNQALHPTAYSVRSAPASSRR